MSLLHQVRLDTPTVHYPLDDASGAVALDRSGNARNGTYGNTPTLGAAGPAGLRGITLAAASSEWVETPAAAWLNSLILGSWTVELWARWTDSTSRRLLGKRGNSGNNFQCLVWNNYPTAGRLSLYTGASGVDVNSLASVATTLNDGQWRHFVFVRDTSGSPVVLRLYIDGALDGSRNEAEAPAANAVTIGFFLGYDGYATPFFDGSMAQFALYSTPLSADRVRAHYQAGSRSGVVL